MKVQYLGDVNDYRKYALLRLLAADGLKIGINWMLTPDDGRPDGNKRSYLAQPERWGKFDPELFDLLTKISPTPSLGEFRQIERCEIIPGALYHDSLVPTGLDARQAYHADAISKFMDRDVVFFDPDNGLAPASALKSRKQGAKFVFDDELEDHYKSGRSLLVYQHFPRIERIIFINQLITRLRKFGPDSTIWACTTSHVAFLLIGNPNGPSNQIGRIADCVQKAQRLWPTNFIHIQLIPTNDIQSPDTA